MTVDNMFNFRGKVHMKQREFAEGDNRVCFLKMFNNKLTYDLLKR